MYGKPLDAIGFVKEFDPIVAEMMDREFTRQKEGIELIASENFASPAVIAAMGSVLTNKYAEGLPGKRYYGGCQFVDELEALCIDRAKTLFGAECANVQPHSGAQANLAVELAFLQPGDTLMGMSLANGGHLTTAALQTCPENTITWFPTMLTTKPVFWITIRFGILQKRTNPSF